MKQKSISLLLFAVFATVVFTAMDAPKSVKKINCTELNGDGCVCHTVIRTPEVAVWVEGPDTLREGQSGIYKMYLAKGPAIAGGYNIATRFGTLNIMDTISVLLDNEITQRIPLVFPTVHDTIYWYFTYTAPFHKTTDTIYSCGISVNYDGEPTELDQWNYGPKFAVTITSGTLPVEITAFSALNLSGKALLTWTTSSETNNKGFWIQKSFDQHNWTPVQFVPGAGTTTTANNYRVELPTEAYVVYYRLQQIDYSGAIHFSETVACSAEIAGQRNFSFSAYPNPGNPSTNIVCRIPAESQVTVALYSVTGQLIRTLYSGMMRAGEHILPVSGSRISSGVYIARMDISAQGKHHSKMQKIVFTK